MLAGAHGRLKRNQEIDQSKAVIGLRRPLGLDKSLFERAKQLVGNVALAAQQLVALAGQVIDLRRLAAALHADIAEVAEKVSGLERTQQLGGKRGLEPGGAAELGDRQEAVALDEVETDEGVFGEGQACGR